MASRLIPRTTGQKDQPVAESPQDLVDRKNPAARRRELGRERKTFQSDAELRDRTCILL